MYVCFRFRVRVVVEVKRKNKSIQIRTCVEQILANTSGELPSAIERLCQRKRWKLRQPLSWQAQEVAFAFHQTEGYSYLSSEEKRMIPLPEQGAEKDF